MLQYTLLNLQNYIIKQYKKNIIYKNNKKTNVTSYTI